MTEADTSCTTLANMDEVSNDREESSLLGQQLHVDTNVQLLPPGSFCSLLTC
jgi:hypothetical protein